MMKSILCIVFLVFQIFDAKGQNDCLPCSVGVSGAKEGRHLRKEIPRLYHKARSQNPGSQIYNMIHAAAYASSKGWIYAGPIDVAYANGKLISFLFNNDGFVSKNFTRDTSGLKVLSLDRASQLETVSGPPWQSEVYAVDTDDWNYFEKKCPTEPFPRFKYKDNVHVLDQLFNPLFLNSLLASTKAATSNIALKYKSKAVRAPKVAIHVRRGELTKGPFHTRKHTLDAYYFSVVEVIRDRYPNAEVHAFPMLGYTGKAVKSETDKLVEFAGYMKRNVTLHFDTSTTEAWAHFIAADFFIMAHSAYSSVPALLNQNCVVYDHFWNGKLSRHLTLHTLKEKMNTCYKPGK